MSIDVHFFEKALGNKEMTLDDWKKKFVLKKAHDGFYISQYFGLEKHVIIPEKIGDDLVVGIRKNVFSYCEGIESITIPKSVQNIDFDSFEGIKTFALRIYKGSFAYKYASLNLVKKDNIRFEVIE